MLHLSLKRFLRDLFFFILGLIAMFLMTKHVQSPEDIGEPADLQYETRE